MSNGNAILVNWYTKLCASGRYMNYWLYHNLSMKHGLVKHMKYRMFFRKNLAILRELFIDNNYLAKSVNRVFYKTPSNLLYASQNSTNIIVINVVIQLKYTFLPYIIKIFPQIN